MAWILFSILIASTTASAYKFPYSNYYRPFDSQDYREWQFQNIEERSSETETGNGYDYQERARNIQNDERYTDSRGSEIYTDQTEDRSIPYKNREQVLAASLDAAKSRNGNSSYQIVNSPPKVYPILKNRRGVNSESAVVFPGPTSDSREMFKTQLTDDCKDLGICENSPDYPHEYVNKLLSKITDANIRFNLDEETPEIAPRGGHNQSVELCSSDLKIIYPDKARTKTGEVVFIVNRKDKKVQGFWGTQCRAPGKTCDLSFFPSSYTASCKQKITDRYMWAIDASGVLKLATVPMPSCCMCVLQPK